MRVADYRGVNALVLGGSGFIGRWVAWKLSAAGARVAVVVRNRAAARSMQGEIIEWDLAELGRIPELLGSTKPSVTFNLAGYGVDRSERNGELFRRINAQLVEALCAAAAAHRDHEWAGRHIVHAGSALEYGHTDGHLDESVESRPDTQYGQSKLAGTRALARECAARGLRGVTARLFTVYGPGEHPGRLLPALLDAARSRAPLPLTAGAQVRDFTYVEDVAEGMLKLGLTSGGNDLVNLATGRLTTVRCFAETAAAIAGIPHNRLHFGALPTRTEEIPHALVPVRRLERLIGWVPPTSIAEGIRKTLAFEEVAGRPIVGF